MKKYIPLVLAFLTITFTACNKDDSPTSPEVTTAETTTATTSTVPTTTTSPTTTTTTAVTTTEPPETTSATTTTTPAPVTTTTLAPPTQPPTPIATNPPPTQAPPPTTQPPVAVADFEREVFRLFNVERAANGIPPLEWHDELAAVARTHSHDMWIREFFSHTCPSGLDSYDRIENAGLQFGIQWGSNENIATGSSPEDVVNRWMSSTGHRNAILNPQHIYVGVGQSWGLWTANFIFVMRA